MTKPTETAYQLRVFNNINELSVYVDKYHKLLDEVGFPYLVFFRLDWLGPIAKIYTSPTTSARRKLLTILTLWKDEQLVASAFFSKEYKKWSRCGITRLYFSGDTFDALSMCYPGIWIHPKVDNHQCIKDMLSYFMQEDRDWDILDLGSLTFHHQMYQIEQVAHQYPAFAEAKFKKESYVSHHKVLPDSENELLRSYSQNLRKNINSARRRLDKEFKNVEYLCVTTLSDEQLAQIKTLHCDRQVVHQSKGTDREKIFEDKNKAESFTQGLKQLERAGFARHYLMYIEGKLAAFFVNFGHKETLYCHLTAFDVQFSRYSPAKVLVHQMYVAEIKRHTKDVSFLWGTNLLKSQMAPNEIEHYRLQCVNNRFISRLKNTAWMALQWVKQRRSQ